MTRFRIGTAVIAGLVLLSLVIGVATMPAGAQEDDAWGLEMRLAVTGDGELDTIDMTMHIDNDSYEISRLEAQEAGYDSVAERYAEDLVESRSEYESYSRADDVERDEGYAVVITFDGFDETEFENTDISTGDGEVTLELDDPSDPADDPDYGEVTYVVEMPDEIENSNAIEEDGTVATWHLHEETPDRLTVTSGDGSDDGLPGFGVAAALLALLGMAMRVHR